MFISVILVATILLGALSSPINTPCVVTRSVSPILVHEYTFDAPIWDHSMVGYVTADRNIFPMTGLWSYELTFCGFVRLYMGNVLENTHILGWSFGVLTEFVSVDDVPPVNVTNGGVAPLNKRFAQTYSLGDYGPPCLQGRSATVNLYCGDATNSCSDVPGSAGALCLSGSLVDGFCLCSFGFTAELSVCSGLWFNLLSNKCPIPKVIHPDQPIPAEPPAELAGAIIGVLIVLVFLCFLGGYIYNYTVHTKRGAEAIPFYDTCTGMSKSTSYRTVT